MGTGLNRALPSLIGERDREGDVSSLAVMCKSA